ncbi:MAG: DUF3696 domain-containing protein [Pirellulaceae bacterium]
MSETLRLRLRALLFYPTIQRLRLDEEGEFIDEWPHGFFEESYNEVFGTGGDS